VDGFLLKFEKSVLLNKILTLWCRNVGLIAGNRD